MPYRAYVFINPDGSRYVTGFCPTEAADRVAQGFRGFGFRPAYRINCRTRSA